MPKRSPQLTVVFSHENRFGKRYFLYAGKTRRGNPAYHFSTKAEPNPLSEIPAGYEVLEKPNGQVFLRKPPKKLIHDDELETIRTELAKYPKCKGVIVEVERGLVTLHCPDTGSLDRLYEALPFPLIRGATWEEYRIKHATYTPMMRFVLLDKTARTFQTERYCFRGSIDRWIDVGRPGGLAALCRLYVRHLGEESFYELM
ncbi:MAG: hypothetical protein HYY24_00010 [Verrucomicrobia bacterium]|nr:hypothetical protein [Verrucomicrobiota bacterium]